MGKAVYIAEKPSVAQEFAKALKLNAKRKDGYLESEEAIVTWCVGHLVTMSYPEVYDPALKKWSLNTLPFLPQEFQYEVIPGVAKQFQIVSFLLNRQDVDTIYVCTDSAHCHIMLTMRPLDERGAWAAKSKKEYDLDENGALRPPP